MSAKPSAPAPVGCPDPVAWIELVGKLRASARIEREYSADGASPELASTEYALAAVVDFLMKHDGIAAGVDCLGPLMRLYAAVMDLKHGKVHEIFKPARGGGNPGKGIGHEITKGLAAKAMSMLMKGSRTSEKDAAVQVARALEVKPSTIRNWRDNLNQGPGPGASEAALFAYLSSRPTDGDTPVEQAHELLSDLKKHRFD